jgi:hypothetical protein
MSFVETRETLHELAGDLSRRRKQATGSDDDFTLAVLERGWGTPPFVDGGQVRVEGAELVTRAGDGSETRAAIDVDEADAARLGEFFAFVQDVLETLIAEAAAPSAINLFPEHFDVAFDDREVTFGGSPGDENHDEPYLYVGPWTAPDPGPAWNANGFQGAEAPWGTRAEALDFLRSRRDRLLGHART